jgi:BirA family biotin operon repressor/biotin-[acetyl-CoA-carboxylase] ligase
LQALAAGRAQRIVALAETCSTNEAAKELARDGAPHGTVVIADSQTAGRGRLGRAWASAAGLGLWCSVLLRPPLSAASLGPLPLVAALAGAAAVETAGGPGIRCMLKWPNDLLIGCRKAGGILMESSAIGGSAASTPDFVVLGVGINVGHRLDDFPPELREQATSLWLEGAEETTPGQVGAAFVLLFDRLYRQFLAEGFGPLRASWLDAADLTGRDVRVTGLDGTLTGVAEGVDAQGRLLLRLSSGRVESISAGDISMRPDGGAD